VVNLEDVRAFVDSALHIHGRIDTVVNNAGAAFQTRRTENR
jgi:NAD(P)-dependent dehydrogenase (short-subunit alcohol dehydrogenase family)